MTDRSESSRNPIRTRSARRWRTPAIVALSVGMHALVLGWMGARSIGPKEPAGPVERFIHVDMEPRPLLAGEVARVRPPPARPPQALPAGAPIAPGDPPHSPPQRTDEPEPRLPATGAPAPPADVGTAPWRVRSRTLGDRIGSGLRTRAPGCASPTMLGASERALCDDRFGARAGAAAPVAGSGNPERDARFATEGAQRLADYARRRRPLSGRPGVSLPDDCGGSNLGFGCAGSHLAPEFRQDRESTLNQVLGADRGDPGAPRLPRAGQADD